MAILQVVKGSAPGQIIELDSTQMVLGRHPSCQIVLDNAAVSRRHAQILETHGTYYVEDLRSRNGTYLNGELLDRREQLHDEDEVRVCDLTFRFLSRSAALLPSTGRDIPETEATIAAAGMFARPSLENDGLDRSSIISRLDVGASESPRLSLKPEAKLRSVMQISSELVAALDIDDILPKTLDCLFEIFPQADQGLILLPDPSDGEMQLKAIKSKFETPGTAVPLSSTIIDAAVQSRQAILSGNAGIDERFENSASIASLRIRSVMCVPLIGHREDLLGVIQISTQDASLQFTAEDLDLLGSVSSQASMAIENADLHGRIRAQRELERELELATQIQLGFLPQEPPKIAEYEFADFYEAAHRVGGDYFDYIPLPDGRIALTLGDVAGKGIAAALLMARLHASARYQLMRGESPSAAMLGLNEEIVHSGLGHRFITLVILVLDPAENQLTISNAGHMAPLVITADAKVAEYGQRESGLPLGVTPDAEYGDITLKLNVGDAVLMYTDGISESMDRASHLYGTARLSSLLAAPSQSAEAIVDRIVTDVEGFRGEQPQGDDMCIVCVRRAGQAAPADATAKVRRPRPNRESSQ